MLPVDKNGPQTIEAVSWQLEWLLGMLLLCAWGNCVLDVVLFSQCRSHVHVVGEAQGFFFVCLMFARFAWGWCALALFDGSLCHLWSWAATSGCLQGTARTCLMDVGVLIIPKLLLWDNGQDVFYAAARKYGFFPAKTTKKQIKAILHAYCTYIYIYVCMYVCTYIYIYMYAHVVRPGYKKFLNSSPLA